jgi:hypothetical protein
VARQDRYIPTLDGWRGFAVIGVILYHGQSGFFRGNSLLTKLSANGFLGVDLFLCHQWFFHLRPAAARVSLLWWRCLSTTVPGPASSPRPTLSPSLSMRGI